MSKRNLVGPCVPLPVPRAQATITIRPMFPGRSIFPGLSRFLWLVESSATGERPVVWTRTSVLDYFGPRRPR